MIQNVNKTTAAVVGVSGYSGMEAARILSEHPGFSLALAVSDRWAGARLGDRLPISGASSDVTVTAQADAVDRLGSVAVVFLCTPQHGSFLAAMSFAQIVGSFVALPSELTKRILDVMSRNPGKIAFQSLEDIPTSIDNMTPGNPFIRSLAEMPIAPGIRAHSIIAVDADGPLDDASDGVVKCRSAHIDGVESELVVHSGHSAQDQPAVIDQLFDVAGFQNRDDAFDREVSSD